jgi:hypothetical protein
LSGVKKTSLLPGTRAIYRVKECARCTDPVPGCGGGFEAIGVIEDSEPASMAAGMSYAMFAEDAAVYTILSIRAIEVVVEGKLCSTLIAVTRLGPGAAVAMVVRSD